MLDQCWGSLTLQEEASFHDSVPSMEAMQRTRVPWAVRPPTRSIAESVLVSQVRQPHADIDATADQVHRSAGHVP